MRMSVSSQFFMFRRLIAFMLIFALLGYGVAWAFAGPASDIADYALGSVHQDSAAALDEATCDHFCHAAAHMMGLAPALPRVRHPDADSFCPAPGGILGTLVVSPLLKPPRSWF